MMINLGKPSKTKIRKSSELGGGGVYPNPNFKNISNLELYLWEGGVMKINHMHKMTKKL